MELREFLAKENIIIESNVMLSSFTGMPVEGEIPILAYPSNLEQIVKLYSYLCKHDYSYEIVAGMSNTYLCSGFFRDILISTKKVKTINWLDSTVEVSCGYNLTKFAREVSNRSITGYEGFVGIPGTIGGAIINNSGAFDSCVEKVLKSVRIIDKQGEEKLLSKADLLFSTRNSVLKFKDFGLLVSAVFDISSISEQSSIDNKIARFSKIRRELIDGNRKSLGSIIAGHTVREIWLQHKFANFIRKILYAPFKYTKLRRRAQCFTDFLVLGGLRFVKYCDNIGRFCWTKETKESVFFDYLKFIKAKSNNKIVIEVEIKK